MQAIGLEWPRLLATLEALDEYYDAISIEDFVPVWQGVMRLSVLGVRFDDAFLAWLERLQAGVRDTADDGDSDDADWFIDCEDTDEDKSVDDDPCDLEGSGTQPYYLAKAIQRRRFPDSDSIGYAKGNNAEQRRTAAPCASQHQWQSVYAAGRFEVAPRHRSESRHRPRNHGDHRQ